MSLHDNLKDFNKFLEKENSVFSDLKDQRTIKKKEIDPETGEEQDENIQSEILQLESIKKSPVETREFLGKINPNLLSGGDAPANIKFTGEIETKSIIIGRKQFTVRLAESIQHSINRAKDNGGGQVRIQAGVYFPTTDIDISSALQLIGENASTTIIDFTGTSFGIVATGTDVYTTGTIIAVTSSVIVTGSGTEWLSNVTTDHQLFIANRWYRISSVVSDTTIILAEGHDGAGTFPGLSYRAAKVVKDIEFEELTIKSSGGTAIKLTDCRNVLFDDVELPSNNKGIVFNNVSEIAFDTSLIPSSTDNGMELNSCALANINALSIPGSGGHGLVINNGRLLTISASSFAGGTGATSDGLNITSGDSITVQANMSANGRFGAHLISGNRNIIFISGNVNGNISDGIRYTATTNECKILAGYNIDDNGGFGVNIIDSTSNNNIIADNFFDNNTLGPINNKGTDTSIRDNIGAHNTTWYRTKTGDYTLTVNDDVITVKTGVATVTITIPTAVGIQGKQFTIKKLDTGGSLVLDPNGSETIDDGLTAVISTQYLALTIISDGANWWII